MNIFPQYKINVDSPTINIDMSLKNEDELKREEESIKCTTFRINKNKYFTTKDIEGKK